MLITDNPLYLSVCNSGNNKSWTFTAMSLSEAITPEVFFQMLVAVGTSHLENLAKAKEIAKKEPATVTPIKKDDTNEPQPTQPSA